ncbi:MAG: Pirin, partial [uncultured Sphingomonas sp.]
DRHPQVRQPWPRRPRVAQCAPPFLLRQLPRPTPDGLGSDPRVERRRDRCQERLSAASPSRHGNRHLRPRWRDHPPGLHGQQGPNGPGGRASDERRHRGHPCRVQPGGRANDLVPDMDRNRQARGAAKLGRHAVPQGLASRQLSAARQRRSRRRYADHQLRRPGARRNGRGRGFDHDRCSAGPAPLSRAERASSREWCRGWSTRRDRGDRRSKAPHRSRGHRRTGAGRRAL